MEVLRSIKITVEVDTNKATYRESFDDTQINEMFDWLEDYTGTNYRTSLEKQQSYPFKIVIGKQWLEGEVCPNCQLEPGTHYADCSLQR